MELKIKATATATEQGLFTAVISSASVDLEGDVVNPYAMVKAFEKWSTVDKKIPLTWNHSGAAEDIIGHIDPATAKAVAGEVFVDGWIDQSTERGAEAWRLVKSGTLGFSYGAMVDGDSWKKNEHGGMDIDGLDIFEATATPTPMNRDTRVAAWKAEGVAEAIRTVVTEELQGLRDEIAELRKTVDGQADDPSRTVDPLRKQADQVALDVASGGVSRLPIGRPDPTPEPPVLMELDALKVKSRDLMLQVLSGVDL